MSLQWAVLAIIEEQPLSGYDIKKRIQQSPYLYWSGNNNQIYKALSQLHSAQLVRFYKEQQETLPTKKIYSITEEGSEALRQWALSQVSAGPVIKNPFLIGLMGSSQLDAEQLEHKLREYREQMSLQLLMQQERRRRGIDSDGMWQHLSDYVVRFYQREIEWVDSVIQKISHQ